MQGCLLLAGTHRLLLHTALFRVGTTQWNLGWKHEVLAPSSEGVQEGGRLLHTLDAGDILVLVLPQLSQPGVPLALEALDVPVQVVHDTVGDAEQLVTHLGWRWCKHSLSRAQTQAGTLSVVHKQDRAGKSGPQTCL